MVNNQRHMSTSYLEQNLQTSKSPIRRGSQDWAHSKPPYVATGVGEDICEVSEEVHFP
jgi:hypothetical protein